MAQPCEVVSPQKLRTKIYDWFIEGFETTSSKRSVCSLKHGAEQQSDDRPTPQSKTDQEQFLHQAPQVFFGLSEKAGGVFPKDHGVFGTVPVFFFLSGFSELFGYRSDKASL